MATGKERRAMALLMEDRSFQAAWTNLRQAVATVSPADLDDPEAICAAINEAMQSVEEVIASSPKLTAIAEAADSTEH